MKKMYKFNSYLLPAILLVTGLFSCTKKDAYLGFTPGTGAPTITSVRTVSKSTVDSTRTTSVYTYSSTGVVTTVTNPNYNPAITAFDSTTVTGNLGNYYAVNGTNLGSTTKIVINGVSIYFNRSLNSDTWVTFSIPTSIPYVQPQSNTIVITTLYGSVSYKFTVLPPPPTIVSVSDFDFSANSSITLTGKGFASVTAVKLKTTGDVVTVVSQNDSTMVIKFPVSTATESALVFTYSGSSNAATATSSAIFNNLDNAYKVFANNNYANGWFDNSWTAPSGLSTKASYSGTASIIATYPAGGWQIEGWADWNTPGKFAYDPAYKYLSFWVKGGTVVHTLVLVGDQMVGGYNQVQNANAYAAQLITVPPNVWTFFKIPLGTPSSTVPTLLNFWANGTPAQQLGFFLQGQGGDVNETYYFDEVAFLK